MTGFDRKQCADFVNGLSEFAFFPIKPQGNTRSIPRLILYTRKVTANIVKEGAAADGWDSM